MILSLIILHFLEDSIFQLCFIAARSLFSDLFNSVPHRIVKRKEIRWVWGPQFATCHGQKSYSASTHFWRICDFGAVQNLCCDLLVDRFLIPQSPAVFLSKTLMKWYGRSIVGVPASLKRNRSFVCSSLHLSDIWNDSLAPMAQGKLSPPFMVIYNHLIGLASSFFEIVLIAQHLDSLECVPKFMFKDFFFL